MAPLDKNLSIILPNGVHLSPIVPGDKPRFVELLQERTIYQQTLNIPFPYTEEDADYWIALNQRRLEEQGEPTLFAVRDTTGLLIGGAGFDYLTIGKESQAEIGYWLGKPYWRQGITTQVVEALCSLAFDRWGLTRITARIFAFNIGSEKVLRKVGFELEDELPHHYKKDGKSFAAKVFALSAKP